MSNTSVATQLREKIENKFSPAYLFDATHELWRALVSPVGGESSGEQPPLVPVSALFGFVDITSLCSSVDAAERTAEIAAALATSGVVAVEENSGKVALRRREWLREADDPERRTVFAKPIHVDSTAAQVSSFFARYGEVEAVQLRTFVDATSTKRRPSAFIVFKREQDAKACVAACPSYGTLSSGDLGNLFVPKLTVMTKRAFLDQAADDAEREHAQQQKREVVAAQTAAAPPPPVGAAAGGAAKPQSAFADVKKFLTPNRTCVAPSVPEGATWDKIKAKLGGLSVDLPALAGKITLVKVDDDRRAFIVTKTPRAAEDLLLAFNRADGDYAAKIKEMVPTLRAATKEEDEYAMRHYTEWSKRKVEHKIGENIAHQRKRPE